MGATLDALRSGSSTAFSGWPEWEVFRTPESQGLGGFWVLRHGPSDFVLRRSSLSGIELMVQPRTSCCGTGFEARLERSRTFSYACLNCGELTPFRRLREELPRALRPADRGGLEAWLACLVPPLEANLLASEVEELAAEAEAMLLRGQS